MLESDTLTRAKGYSLSLYDGSMGTMALRPRGEAASQILSDGARAIVTKAGAVETKTLKDAVTAGDVRYWRDIRFGVEFLRGKDVSSVEIIFDRPTVFGETDEPVHPKADQVLSNLRPGADQDDVFIGLEFVGDPRLSKADKLKAIMIALMEVRSEKLESFGRSVGLFAKFSDGVFRLVGSNGVLGLGGLPDVTKAAILHKLDCIVVFESGVLGGLSPNMPRFINVATDVYKSKFGKLLFDSESSYSLADNYFGQLKFTPGIGHISMYECRASFGYLSIFGASESLKTIESIIEKPVGNKSMTLITSLLTRISKANGRKEKLMFAISLEGTVRIEDRALGAYLFP